MKKAILFVVVSAFIGFTVLSASAANMVSGAYDPNQSNSGVMSVRQTIIQVLGKQSFKWEPLLG